MGTILYTAILLYGINVMSSVLEEKTTRMVEVLVSSLRPFQLLLGKILGVGAVSIFQFLIWGVAGRPPLGRRAGAAGGGGGGGGGGVPGPRGSWGGGGGLLACFFSGGVFFFLSVFVGGAARPP